MRKPLIERAAGQFVLRAGDVVVGLELLFEGRIQRQPEVGAGAFQVGGDGVGAAEDQLLVQHVGRIGEADARLEVLLVGVVQGAIAFTIGACPEARPGLRQRRRQFQLSGELVEVGLAVFHFHPRRVVFPAQAEIQGQVIGDAPVVLEVERPRRWSAGPRCRIAGRGPNRPAGPA